MREWNTQKILSVLWKGKYLIIVLSVVSAIFGYIYNKNYTVPKYTSTSSIILSVTNQDTEEIVDDEKITISAGEISLSEQLMNTYVQIIKSDSVMNKVIENLNLNITSNQLAKSINVAPESKSTVLKISITSDNPKQSVEIISETEKVFFERIEELYNIRSAKVLDEPVIEKTPSNINPKKYAFFGFAIGFVAAITILLVKEFFNSNIKNENDIEGNLKLNVLAKIEHFHRKSKLISDMDEYHKTESFRVLAANLKASNSKSFFVVSNVPEEGKSLVSANMAITFASSGKKTLLIDSDMRKGTQHLLFGINNDEGLSNLVFNDEFNYKKYVHEDVIHNLDILTNGSADLDYSKLLFTETIEKILKDAKEKYDFIIVDGTPCQMVADGTLLYKLVDSTIIVVKYNNTKCTDINKIKKDIKRNGGNLLGVIINDIHKLGGKNYSYSYYGNDRKNGLKIIKKR